MKKIILGILFFGLSSSAWATTWYIRPGGGTRYAPNSPNLASGQCDGQADVDYPGHGVNQHCAFNDLRYMWDDQSYGNDAWVMSGGDTLIIEGCASGPNSTAPACRIGWDTPTASVPGTQTGYTWCLGGNGAYSCFNPPIPAGTPSQHTRILGKNYANCGNGNEPDPSKMTEVFGGYGTYAALNLDGAQYVDVECLEITRHSQCVVHGVPQYPRGCSTGLPLDDYDGNGIITDVHTHDLLLQDLYIHNHTSRGIIGPIGGVVTANRIDIAYNAFTGWDFDDGSNSHNGQGTPNGPGSVLYFNNSIIEWSGCSEEYPRNPNLSIHAISCYSQSTGGFGDGIGTPAFDSMDVYIDHSIFRYNTQDGEDFGHVDTGLNTLHITNSLSYGNNGGQFKWGQGFTNVVFENNLAVANCARLSQPFPGAASTYNQYLQDFCRAFDGLAFAFSQGANALFANNTIITYAPTTMDISCYDANGSCSSSVLTLRNNIFRGYSDSAYDYGGNGVPGTFCGSGCNGTPNPMGTLNRDHNVYYGLRGCIANTTSAAATHETATNEFCGDPLFTGEPPAFVDESTLDNFNFTLAAGSPVIGAGIAVAGLTTDYNNFPWNNPPSMGGLEYGSTYVVPPPPPPPPPGGGTPPPGGGGTPPPPLPPPASAVGSSSVRVYPNPWRKDKHANSLITFDNMAAGSTVKIFTVSGHKVKELDGSSGTATWNLTNDSGDHVASGLYIYLIKDSQGNKFRGKVAIIQ